MKVKFVKVALFGWLVTMSSLVSIAHAGLIIDTSNDSFIDTSTGLEWMDFGINNNQSYNYVTSQLGEGGVYEGWSLATSSQVYNMWANVFLGFNPEIEEINRDGDETVRVKDGYGVDGSVFTETFNKLGINEKQFAESSNERYFSLGWFQDTSGMSFVAVTQYTEDYDWARIVESEKWDAARSMPTGPHY